MSGIEVGVAYLSILPSTSKIAPGVRKALGEVESDAKRSGMLAGSSFASSLGTTVKKGLLGATAGLGLLGGLGIKAAADMEQTKISLETLLGSSAKAEAEMSWLTKTSAATPFELADLAQATKTLAGFGFKSSQIRRGFLTDMGNIASAIGLPSSELGNFSRVFGQVHAAGRVSLEDLNQLIDAGVPVWEALGKQTGKSVGQMREAISKGEISARTFEAAMSDMARNRFGDAMSKQSKTLNGQLSTLKDTINLGLGGAIKPMVPLLKDGIAGASKILGPALTGVAVALTATVEGVSDLTGWVKKNEAVIVPLATGVGVLATGLLAMAVAQKVAAEGGLLKFLTGATKATKAYAFAQGILNTVIKANPIVRVVTVLAALAAGLVVAYKKSETFRRIVDGALRGVGDAFTWLKDSVVMPVFRFFGDKIGWLMNKFGDMLIGLSKVPGFGWAREAGLKMKGAAAEARGLGDSLKGIKSPPKVRITVEYGSLQDAVAAADTLMGKLSNIGDYLAQPSNYTVPGNVSGPVPKNPRMATGGIVRPRPGGVDVTVAEVGRPEAVVPLDRYDRMVRASSEGRRYAESASGRRLGGAPLVLEFEGKQFPMKVRDMARGEAVAAIADEFGFRGAIAAMA